MDMKEEKNLFGNERLVLTNNFSADKEPIGETKNYSRHYTKHHKVKKGKYLGIFIGFLMLFPIFFSPASVNAATYLDPIKVILSAGQGDNSVLVVSWPHTSDFWFCFKNYQVRMRKNEPNNYGWAQGSEYLITNPNKNYLSITYYTDIFQGSNGNPIYLKPDIDYNIRVYDYDVFGNKPADNNFIHTSDKMSLYLSQNSPTSVSVFWDDNAYTNGLSKDGNGYYVGGFPGIIYRKSSSENYYHAVHTFESNYGTWIDTSITPGETYSYYFTMKYEIHGPGISSYLSVVGWSNKYSITTKNTNSIQIISPNGGENWKQGTTNTIVWAASRGISSVKIQLYCGNQVSKTIIANAPNNGRYTWAIPPMQAASSSYKIKITDASDNSVYDDSNLCFTIAESKKITVTSPNGGERWQQGSSHMITWASTSSCANSVKIHLYKAGYYYNTIATNTPNDGSYLWNIPSFQELSSSYSIIVADGSDSSTYDCSDAAFSIASIPLSEPPAVTLLSTTSTSTSSITAVWTQYTGNYFQKYLVQYTTDSSWTQTYNAFPVYQLTTTTTSITGLQPQTTYYVRIQTVTSSGYNPSYVNSNINSATTNTPQSQAPPAVALQTVIPLSTTSLSATWTQYTGNYFQKYLVQYTTDSSWTQTYYSIPIFNQITTSVPITGLEPQTTYYVRISVIANSGYNPLYAYSNVKSMMTSLSTDFVEDFETGYDGWQEITGIYLYAGTQIQIKYQGASAFKMTSNRESENGYAGQYSCPVDISVTPGKLFTFSYYFPSKSVSYVGYLLDFNNGKEAYYISLFSGWFVNNTYYYLCQYPSEQTNTWYTHTANIYDNYQNVYGTVPSDLKITKISMIMGDPYFIGQAQTAYFDSLTIN